MSGSAGEEGGGGGARRRTHEILLACRLSQASRSQYGILCLIAEGKAVGSVSASVGLSAITLSVCTCIGDRSRVHRLGLRSGFSTAN